MTRSPTVWAVVVGGGSSRRFGRPKQYESLGEERVIDRSCRIAAAACDGVVAVVPSDDLAHEAAWLRRAGADVVVAGGATRSASVRAGLSAVPATIEIVCVHDAARPLASRELYRRVIAAVDAGAAAAVPGIPVTDTIKVVDAGGVVVSTPDRAALVAVQTPQAFRARDLRAAHAVPTDVAATDDAMMVEAAGGLVVVVDGEPANRKITEPGDLDWARQALAADGSDA
jgi:2-C-methyl-D-erythritol 4-phosphate cytidylyltransferase